MTDKTRRAARLPVTVEVHVTTTSDHNFYTGFTSNISEGGIFVATSQICNLGTELDFTFTLEPDPNPITIRGIVRWIREDNQFTVGLNPGMGVQFLDLDEASQERVNAFISRRRDSIFYDD